MAEPNPIREVVRRRAPKREQMVLTEADMRGLIDAAAPLGLRALVRRFCELALRFSEAAFRSPPTTRRSARCASAPCGRWRPLVRRAGFVERDGNGRTRPRNGLTPHVLRHSRASLIASRHSELFAPKLQRFLGHHSVTFTLEKYGSHFSKGILEPDE